MTISIVFLIIFSFIMYDISRSHEDKIIQDRLKKQLRVKYYQDWKRNTKFIYVYRDKLLWIKIGKTTNIYNRIRTHQTSHATSLHIIAIIPVSNSDYAESFLHKRYEKYRYKREFFWATPKLLSELKMLACPLWTQHIQDRLQWHIQSWDMILH